MEYRIFDTIINVDKVLDEQEKSFITVVANFVELILNSDKVFMAVAMIKMSSIAQLVREGMLNRNK